MSLRLFECNFGGIERDTTAPVIYFNGDSVSSRTRCIAQVPDYRGSIAGNTPTGGVIGIEKSVSICITGNGLQPNLRVAVFSNVSRGSSKADTWRRVG